MNLFNVCTNVVVVGKINRSSSTHSHAKVNMYDGNHLWPELPKICESFG